MKNVNIESRNKDFANSLIMESFEVLSFNETTNESKLKSFTVEEKLKLIKQIENGKTVKDVSEEFGVNRNTLHYILKNKDKFKNKEKCNPAMLGFKRIRDVKYPELDQRILDLMYNHKNRGEKISGNTIKALALEIAAELNFKDFSGSNGWLCSFLKRHKIKLSEFNDDPRFVTDPTNDQPPRETSLDEEPVEEHFVIENAEEIGYENSGVVEEVTWEYCTLCGNTEETELINQDLVPLVNSLLNVRCILFYMIMTFH